MSVLDEPTAALDAGAEHHVFTGRRDLAKDRAVLLITHRLADVAVADRILVLEQGRLVQEGTYPAPPSPGSFGPWGNWSWFTLDKDLTVGEDGTLRVASATAAALEEVTDRFSVALGGAFPPRRFPVVTCAAGGAVPAGRYCVRAPAAVRPFRSGPAGTADQMSTTR